MSWSSHRNVCAAQGVDFKVPPNLAVTRAREAANCIVIEIGSRITFKVDSSHASVLLS